MKNILVGLVIGLGIGDMLAATSGWEPSPGHTQIPIWPGPVPDARPVTEPETATTVSERSYVAGKPWVSVSPVSQPTITVYSPEGKNTRPAIIVFPGGGYWILAIDLEGTEVCDWLTSKGITAILLKYRVPGHPQKAPRSGPYPDSSEALEDAQRALSLVRFHASEWHIDPHKIGVLGFSAGGHLVAAMSTHFEQRLYKPVDEADKESCRPDFALALYPGHLSVSPDTVELNPDIRAHITPQTPPTFLLQNEDDHVDRVEDSVSYFLGLKKVGVPVEMHIYAEGGHAFGLRRTKHPATEWPSLVEKWLTTTGMISR
jgi:acetyl esterase/lipase